MTKQSKQDMLQELWDTLTTSNLNNTDILKDGHSFFCADYEIQKIQGCKDAFYLYEYGYEYSYEVFSDVKYIDTVKVINKFMKELNKGEL